MPGELGEDACLDPILGIGAAIEILGEQPLALGMSEEILVQQIELLGRDLAVLVPPDRLLGLAVANDELVLGAAAGMDAGLGGERGLTSRGRNLGALPPRHGA